MWEFKLVNLSGWESGLAPASSCTGIKSQVSIHVVKLSYTWGMEPTFSGSSQGWLGAPAFFMMLCNLIFWTPDQQLKEDQ